MRARPIAPTTLVFAAPQMQNSRSMDFVIHPQLIADSHYLGKLRMCHLLLHRNAILPWFILVPETAIPDLLDLSDDVRRAAMDEAATVARFIKTRLGYTKINFAAIGNV